MAGSNPIFDVYERKKKRSETVEKGSRTTHQESIVI